VTPVPAAAGLAIAMCVRPRFTWSGAGTVLDYAAQGARQLLPIEQPPIVSSGEAGGTPALLQRPIVFESF